MKYFIRSVKYFFYFSFLTTAIVLALVATGLASGDIDELFEGGYTAIWKIAVFFVLVASVYPIDNSIKDEVILSSVPLKFINWEKKICNQKSFQLNGISRMIQPKLFHFIYDV